MRRQRLLLADNDPFTRCAVQCAAAMHELEVIPADSVREVSMLAAQSQPDLIVLELAFAGGNGLDLLSRLKSDTELASIPVLIWSEQDPSSFRPLAMRLGAVDCLQKTDTTLLLGEVKTLLRQGLDDTTTRLAGLASVIPGALGESRPPPQSGFDLSLQALSDSEGSLEIGWLGAQVLYSRLTGSLSAQLLGLFTLRLPTLVRSATQLEYFIDARALRDFDPATRSNFARAVSGSRAKFAALEMLAWVSSASHERETLAALLGKPCRIHAEQADFEKRLYASAPHAHRTLLERARLEAVR